MTDWMPAAPDRDQLPDSDRALFDAVQEREMRKYGRLGTYFGGLLNAPAFAQAVSHLGHVMRGAENQGFYSNADRELIDMVLAVEMDQAGVFAGHLPDAVAYGVRPAAIAAVCARDDDALTERERILVDYIRAVYAGQTTEHMFQSVAGELGGPRIAVAYTVAIAYLIFTFRMLSAFGIGRGPADGSLADPYVNGTAEVVQPPAGRAS